MNLQYWSDSLPAWQQSANIINYIRYIINLILCSPHAVPYIAECGVHSKMEEGGGYSQWLPPKLAEFYKEIARHIIEELEIATQTGDIFGNITGNHGLIWGNSETTER